MDNHKEKERQARILIVDDEETLCEAIRFNIEEEGFEADVAYSAEEALALDLSSYSLFLLDVMMGDISGTQLAKIIKSREDTKSIPIIFCTARDTEQEIVDGLDLGADDYITKPFRPRELVSRIRSVLRRCGGLREAERCGKNEYSDSGNIEKSYGEREAF